MSQIVHRPKLALAAVAGSILISAGVTVRDDAREELTAAAPEVIALEREAQGTLRAICTLLFGTDRRGIQPAPAAPLSADRVAFPGINGSQSAQDELRLEHRDDGRRRAVWVLKAGSQDEHAIVLSERVAPLLEGEVPNGMDDNGNGLIDEPGMCFVHEDGTVTIRLTLERDVEGELLRETVMTTVSMR